MFTAIFAALEQGQAPDFELLRRRFDLAMTKKLGVVQLPPTFWMQDSKINPRADHLLQVALLLGDRERCELAVSVLAVEISEQKTGPPLEAAVGEILTALLTVAPAGLQDQIISLGTDLMQEPLS